MHVGGVTCTERSKLAGNVRGGNSASVLRVMMIDKIRINLCSFFMENESDKVRLRQGTFVQGWLVSHSNQPWTEVPWIFVGGHGLAQQQDSRQHKMAGGINANSILRGTLGRSISLEK